MMHLLLTRLLAIALLATGGAAAAQSVPDVAAVDARRLAAANKEPGNWMAHGRTYDEQRFSPLAAIHSDNVSQLGLSWYADLDTERGQEATPIVVDGVMYVSTAWSKVLALDARTGKQLWTFDPKVPGEWAVHGCCDVVNRGVAVWMGRVYIGTFDGRLIALDARTGQPVWEQLTIDRRYPYTITGAPRIVKGKVVIGNAGAEMGVRGYVTAYDASSGRQLWRFYTVPGNPADPHESPAMAMAAKTWDGEWWKQGGGGTVWDSMAYDPELDLLYIGVGNGSPWDYQRRSNGKGDNLFLSSIVAIKPDTGRYVWHYQTTPGDNWDFTATQHMILADLKIEGRTRKVLMQAPKNGFFYVLDRRNGKLISAKNFVPVNWTSGLDPRTGRPQVNPEALYGRTGKVFLANPGPPGAHSWHPMTFSPKTGLVYIPAMDIAYPLASDPDYATAKYLKRYNSGTSWSAFVLPPDEKVRAEIRASLKSKLIAWDPVRQREVWRVEPETTGPWSGGLLSTAGNLVFQGTQAGGMFAYRADDGRRVWSADAQTAIMAPPISYAVDGEQYVAVLAGFGGAFGLSGGELARGAYPAANKPRLLAYKLGGTAQLPAASPAPEQRPFQQAKLNADDRTLARGEALFHAHCGTCHGAGAESSGIVPDLRRSPMLPTEAAWRAVVEQGALKSRGMVGFGDVLDSQEIDAIRAYVGSRADEALRRR